MFANQENLAAKPKQCVQKQILCLIMNGRLHEYSLEVWYHDAIVTGTDSTRLGV